MFGTIYFRRYLPKIMNSKLRKPRSLWGVAENREKLERFETFAVALIQVQL